MISESDFLTGVVLALASGIFTFVFSFRFVDYVSRR